MPQRTGTDGHLPRWRQEAAGVGPLLALWQRPHRLEALGRRRVCAGGGGLPRARLWGGHSRAAEDLQLRIPSGRSLLYRSTRGHAQAWGHYPHRRAAHTSGILLVHPWCTVCPQPRCAFAARLTLAVLVLCHGLPLCSHLCMDGKLLSIVASAPDTADTAILSHDARRHRPTSGSERCLATRGGSSKQLPRPAAPGPTWQGGQADCSQRARQRLQKT